MNDTLSAYRAKNPDYNIEFVPGRECSEKDWGQPNIGMKESSARLPNGRVRSAREPAKAGVQLQPFACGNRPESLVITKLSTRDNSE